MFILWLICIVSPNFYSPRQTCLSHKWVIPPPSHTEQLPKPLSLDISTIALVCIVSEPCLDKSEEFNNHSFLELFLVSYRAFLSQKKKHKSRQTLHKSFLKSFFLYSTSMQRCCYPLYQCSHFFLPSLFWGYLSAQVRTNKREGRESEN